jgi:hypothetical protein
VIISFEKYHGFGSDRGEITVTDSNNKDSFLTVESEHLGSPGIFPLILIIAEDNVNIAIFEQNMDIARIFTPLGVVCNYT